MNEVNFEILRLDRFAQGVSQGEKVTFIKKVLPGETGVAQVYRSAKGVLFAQPTSIEVRSEKRIAPKCEHYSDCFGCHYLHVSYEDELKYKMKNFEYELKDYLGNSEPEVLSLERFGYRNRIQLHYNKKRKELGFINSVTKKIASVPNCLILNLQVKKAVGALYRDQSWLELAKEQKVMGHIEVYEQNGEVQISWNQRYAQDGFTQVNTQLNLKLHTWIEKNIRDLYFSNQNVSLLLDLFGGAGNLSSSFSADQKLVFDLYSSEIQKPFVHLDLEEDIPSSFSGECELMIIDPPRRGFSKVKQWLKAYSPEYVLYVSCDVSSLKRDLKTLDNYEVEKSLMIDFFGGSYHYESLVFLKKKVSTNADA